MIVAGIVFCGLAYMLFTNIAQTMTALVIALLFALALDPVRAQRDRGSQDGSGKGAVAGATFPTVPSLSSATSHPTVAGPP